MTVMGSRWFSDDVLSDVHQVLSVMLDRESPVFSLRRLHERGISRPEVLALERAGHVHKIRHGAYCLAEVWRQCANDDALRRRVIASAAIVGMRRPVFACGPFAAELHGLPLPANEPRQIDLIRDLGRDVRPARDGVKPRNRLEGIAIMSRDLSSEDFDTIGGVPVVGKPAAAMTSAAVLNEEFAVAVMDATLASGVTTDHLSAIADRWASVKGMRSAARLISWTSDSAESPLESISRVRLMKRGLPAPILQHSFFDHHGFVGRVDMWWPDWNVVGEADGMAKYDDLEVLRQEKIREDRLRALGLHVVRWTWHEMWSAPGEVAARILAGRQDRRRRARAG